MKTVVQYWLFLTGFGGIMQSLQGKLALITGATAGIGEACAWQFASCGANLIITGRREEKLLALQQQITQEHAVNVLPLSFDVSDLSAVNRALQHLSEEWQPIDFLVNNAGFAVGLDKIQEGNESDWDRVIDTNIKGVLYVTRKVLPGMQARNSGHVINIGSISSYEVYPGGAVYCATKFAVRALSDGIKMDVHGTKIRVSEIDPGMVITEFSKVRFNQDMEKADSVYKNVSPLSAADVAEAVLFCATRPPHVDVRAIKICPTDQTCAFMVNRDE